MKKYSLSKKKSKKPVLSIITVFILVIAIVCILIFTNNSSVIDDNSQAEVKDSSKVEDKADLDLNIKEESPSKEEPKESEKNSDSDSNSEPPIVEKDNEHNVNVTEKPGQQHDQNSAVPDDNGYIAGQTLPSEPTYIDGILVANKKYPLPQSYNPGENVEARVAFEEMAAAARKVGFELTAFSTFRSFDYQSSLYTRYVERDGKDNADRYSARPGYSEHQTGLAFDIGDVDRQDLWLTSEFGESEAGKWLVENAHNYGFILRYPKGKEQITGYMYESWHFRYLGIPVATEVYKSGVTLEEFLGIN